KFSPALSFIKTVSKNVFLTNTLCKENTTALLHAPRSVDKSSQAIDIAVNLSSAGRKVLYIDTQSSLSDHIEQLKNANDNLSIFIPSYDTPDNPTDYADLVLSGIEEAIVETDIRVFIIDSVTRIAALSFGRNASPSYVMKRLVAMQVRYGVSFLVISHDSTRSVDRSLINLADADIVAVESQAEETLPASAMPTIELLKPACDEVTPHNREGRPLTRQQRRAIKRREMKTNHSRL
ncbi:MAG: AAA family ATPase, partial [Muribaculaceae bacterium]|nr:AAA family ATPase [Muribaculaceae bacterium]